MLLQLDPVCNFCGAVCCDVCRVWAVVEGHGSTECDLCSRKVCIKDHCQEVHLFRPDPDSLLNMESKEQRKLENVCQRCRNAIVLVKSGADHTVDS
jgi:hypothetical protein